MSNSESEASSAVQRVLTLRAVGASVGAAQDAAVAAVARHVLHLRARALIPAAAGGPDAALERSTSEVQVLRFVELLDEGSGGNSSDAAAADTGGEGVGARRAPAAAPPAEDALAPLLRLRASLASDVARLAASREALARDKRVLGAAAATHAELAQDAAESHELVRAWAEKERREVWWVGAAAVLLIATATYIALRRVAWLFGVRLW
jgi:hypothetical protein